MSRALGEINGKCEINENVKLMKNGEKVLKSGVDFGENCEKGKIKWEKW